METLLLNIQKVVPLSEKDREIILASFEFRKLEKKETLIESGELTRCVAFVLEGCLRSYSTDDNGFEHILQFAPEGWWITDMSGFVSQSKSSLDIEAIIPSEVMLLTRQNQLHLFDQVPILERYFRILLENSLVSTRRRLMGNLSSQAKNRYLDFEKVYPGLEQKIPQKLIASYIGVTPEFLSKLRSQLLRAH
ncbi:MAG: Crp/Fnr family transcriptional regulator [Flavobacteriales bacterium]